MNKITFPLKPNMKGTEVANLQAALQLLLERKVLLAQDAAARQQLAAALQREQEGQTFASATRKLVSVFQDTQRLESSGVVDEVTAAALNAQLRELGQLDPAEPDRFQVVRGQVLREGGAPASRVRVVAVHEPGEAPVPLGESATDVEGRYSIRYAVPLEVRTIALRVSAVGEDGKVLKASGIVKQAKLLETIDLVVPVATEPAKTRRVTGRIALEHGVAAELLKVRLYQSGFAGTKTLLGEVLTDRAGGYSASYAVIGAANIEVYGVDGDGHEVQLSRTKFDAQVEERIDLVAPSKLQPGDPEFTRLKAAIAPHTGNEPQGVRAAVERGERRDFTFLSSATGWDAGAIALAAEAFEGEARTRIPADGYYALARAGLPTDVRLLAKVSKATVESALRQAAEVGIVDAAVVEKSVQAFGSFASEYRFTNRVAGAPSSPKDFVGMARISAADRAAFANVVRDETRGDVWTRAKAAGVSDSGIQKLQLQGKLAYLTFNNVELVEHLGTKVASDPLELIALGFYEPATWEAALSDLAGADAGKLELLIPAAFSGQTTAERTREYTVELARRVRQMDGHAVTVDRILTGKLEGVAEKVGVGTFLKNATPLGFRLGKTPLGSFVAQHQATLMAGIAAGQQDAVLSSTQTLSSLYSTTPSDEALQAVLQAGFKSATAIAKYDYLTFAGILAEFLPTAAQGGDQRTSKQIFWKAQQQSATVFNLFDGLKRLGSAPYAAGSTPDDAKKRDDQVVKLREKLAGAFPTLETLFGSVDYCECNQCQSVLSPAAYLVDALHFIDPDVEAWATVKASFERRTGSPYSKQKPFDVLNERRPDIKSIALTCENTNVLLPYIDVVNEILEQLMMADETPPAIEAYDVGEASSEDLLAEPQNTLWSAYVGAAGKPGLRDLVYPINLPFDLPLEMVRAFLNQLGLPLWRLREHLARPSTLDASASGRTDGWTDVWFERLGLATADVTALTRADKWHELYGFDSLAAALKMEAGGVGPAQTSLRNGQTLARRLGVTYQELVELVRTRFINPQIENLVALKRVGVDPSTLDRFLGFGPTLSPAERTSFEAELLAQNLTAAELAPLRTEVIRKATLVLLSPSVGCDFSQTTLAFSQDPANPDDAIALVLRKMNAFVRLQKKLGWETHELDRALMALVPNADAVTLGTWPAAMKSALIYLAHVEELRLRFQDRVSREELLVLWSDIPAVGMACLYERLFAAPGTGRDVAFAKRLGKVLQDNTIALTEHEDSILQAFQLAHDDIEPILSAAGAPNRILSLQNISTLMRHAVLAKGLELSIAELLTLRRLSECKPLSPLDASPLADLSKDVPWRETLAFVREVELTRDAGIDVACLERLCCHRGVADEPAAAGDPVLLALAALPPSDPSGPEKRQLLLVQTLAAQLSEPEALVDQLLGNVLKDAANRSLKVTGFTDTARAVESVRKLRKALDLLRSLEITIGELNFVSHVPGALDLNALPLAEVADEAISRALRKGLNAWLELVAARRQLGKSERVLQVLSAARRTVDAVNTHAVRERQLSEAMTALTGLKTPVLAPALAALGVGSAGGGSFDVPLLASAGALRKTVDALKCFTRIRLNPQDVVRFAETTIDEAVAQKLRSSVRARYAPAAWRRLAKPIYDGLRGKQRDALVAHLTHLMDGDTPKYGDTAEKLFEYLLLDPGMEPVVLASRIQLAIASVQLFVQRCLMNLEPEGVDPQIIDSKRWEWMRRYRVWEVNRKMFIWPENWLDPEFRDDKTHLFRDLEGKLLQGDVDEDLVRTSLYAYLKGLEEIARLELLTMYFEPGVSTDGSVVHVVGRTPNAPHKYFYRKASHGMWTPWEPIDVGIEGEHLVLTAWRGRMHLFWASFIEQAEANPNTPTAIKPSTDTVPKENVRSIVRVNVQLHWVERVEGNWVNRSSTSGFVKTAFSDLNIAGLKATTDEEKRSFFVRAVLVEHGAGLQDDDLEIQVTRGAAAHRFVFYSKLAPPRSEQLGNAPTPSPFSGTMAATKWSGNGALKVRFVSAVTQNSDTGTVASGGGEHTVLGGGDGFALLFPSNEELPVPTRTPPAGVGRPTGFVFQPQNAQHVAYRSSDGSIHDLFGTKNGWFYQAPSEEAAGSGSTEDLEPAISDPHGYAVNGRGTLCIAYAGTGGIYELVWSQLDSSLNDAAFLSTGWRNETLYQGASTADHPQGQPFGGLFLPDRGVAFRTKDGRLLAAVEGAGAGPWEIRELNSTFARAMSDPTGLLMTKTALDVTSIVSRHIFYLGDDGDVHEFRSDVAGRTWVHTNITAGIVGIVKPAANAVLAAYAFLGQNTLHVVYRGTDDRIHELWGPPGSWNYGAIGANFKKAKGDPTGYVTESFGTQHVVYRGEDDEVVELWWSAIWRENVLTQAAPGATKAGSNVTGYSFESLRTQHVVYFAEDGTLRELWWNLGGWHSGKYELQNPFPDQLGPLAAPFFYESTRKDHAFFVEPFVVETAVHEWTDWIVTSEEYVDVQVGGATLLPLYPLPIALVPSDVGIIKKADRFKVKLYDEPVLVRTPKGVIQPAVNLAMGNDGTTPRLSDKATRVVDVRRGEPAPLGAIPTENLHGGFR